MLAAIVLVLATASATSSGDPAFRGGWGADAAWIATGLALEGGAIALERELNEPHCPCSDENVPDFDRWPLGRNRKDAKDGSDIGQDTLVFGMPLVAALAVPGNAETRVHAALVTGEAILVTAGVTDVLKAALRRPRPYTYRDDGGKDFGPESYHSMPSGHTSSSFAAATALVTVLHQRRPGWRATPFIAAGAYATAAGVAFLRVDAGVHFPSDVVAGAALGTSVGWAVAASRQTREPAVTIVPSRGGIGLVYRF